ncbi:hypothetical protein [Candidatus Clavichlamydia salmonicola]|uniref:hypothetical protein n=1 Tax=Candidatus Clavichlamydia salmonicola TaxID=469812 RepID=UPI001891DE1D|nr:hypothetical protein [Candidatus Clavichlamydia salmonicola]
MNPISFFNPVSFPLPNHHAAFFSFFNGIEDYFCINSHRFYVMPYQNIYDFGFFEVKGISNHSSFVLTAIKIISYFTLIVPLIILIIKIIMRSLYTFYTQALNNYLIKEPPLSIYPPQSPSSKIIPLPITSKNLFKTTSIYAPNKIRFVINILTKELPIILKKIHLLNKEQLKLEPLLKTFSFQLAGFPEFEFIIPLPLKDTSGFYDFCNTELLNTSCLSLQNLFDAIREVQDTYGLSSIVIPKTKIIYIPLDQTRSLALIIKENFSASFLQDLEPSQAQSLTPAFQDLICLIQHTGLTGIKKNNIKILATTSLNKGNQNLFIESLPSYTNKLILSMATSITLPKMHNHSAHTTAVLKGLLELSNCVLTQDQENIISNATINFDINPSSKIRTPEEQSIIEEENNADQTLSSTTSQLPMMNYQYDIPTPPPLPTNQHDLVPSKAFFDQHNLLIQEIQALANKENLCLDSTIKPSLLPLNLKYLEAFDSVSTISKDTTNHLIHEPSSIASANIYSTNFPRKQKSSLSYSDFLKKVTLRGHLYTPICIDIKKLRKRKMNLLHSGININNDIVTLKMFIQDILEKTVNQHIEESKKRDISHHGGRAARFVAISGQWEQGIFPHNTLPSEMIPTKQVNGEWLQYVLPFLFQEGILYSYRWERSENIYLLQF